MLIRITDINGTIYINIDNVICIKPQDEVISIEFTGGQVINLYYESKEEAEAMMADIEDQTLDEIVDPADVSDN